MNFIILVLSINFLALVSCDKTEVRRLTKHRVNTGQVDDIDEFDNQEALEQEQQQQQHMPPKIECKEKCKCIPDIETVVSTPIRELNVTENTILLCNGISKIKRLEVLNSQYRYNMTCNGVISKRDQQESEIYMAVLKTGDESDSQNEIIVREKEKNLSLKVKDNYSIAHFNKGSETFWSRSIISNTECAGDILISSAHWVANEPLYGCCKDGVNLWTAVTYNVEIIGKCCTTCGLLQSAYASTRPLKNF